MVDLSIYPFMAMKKKISLLIIPFIAIAFVILSFCWIQGSYSLHSVGKATDELFGGSIELSGTDPAKYDEIGADGLIPIMRFGGITKTVNLQQGIINGIEKTKIIIVLIALVLQYLAFAVVSRTVFNMKNGINRIGTKGINSSTLLLSILAALTVVVISSFSMQGFQLVLLLNFGVIFALAIPHAAAGDSTGESFYQASEFMRFNLRGLVTLYLLCMGVAITAPIGLLLIFMFPLSVLSKEIVPYAKWGLSMLGISFALAYQFIITSRAVYDFHRKIDTKAHAFKTRLARRIKQ